MPEKAAQEAAKWEFVPATPREPGQVYGEGDKDLSSSMIMTTVVMTTAAACTPRTSSQAGVLHKDGGDTIYTRCTHSATEASEAESQDEA